MTEARHHADRDVLADLDAGLLDPGREAQVVTHLAGCLTCRSLHADLAEVSRLLAAAPSPALPPEVAARLDTAVTRSVAERATAFAPTTRLLPPARWRRRLVPLAAAAAVVAVIALVAPDRDLGNSTSGPAAETSAPFVAGGAAGAQRPTDALGTPSLSSAHFRRDVQRKVLRGRRALDVPPLARGGTGLPQQLRMCPPGLLPSDAVRLVARLDGRPVLLALFGNRTDVTALAVSCRAGGATVLARADHLR